MRYPVTILGEIHFSYRVIFELLQNDIIPDTIIIKDSSFEKFDKSIFNINDNWTSVYRDYHINWKKNLIDICEKYEINLFITSEVLSVISCNKYLIVAGFSTILKNDILQYFELPLNIHPSLLPYFKGPQPEAQMIYNKQDYFGITIHLITSRIDSGEIYFQQRLNQQKMNIYELEIVEGKIASQGVKDILLKKNKIIEIERQGSYYSFLKNKELKLNNKKINEIIELMRILPEEFPYFEMGNKTIYPIELSQNKTYELIDIGTDKIYLNKWIEKSNNCYKYYSSVSTKN